MSSREIRLRAEYSTASATVAELTRVLSKGGVTLETRNPMPLGTRFVFELRSPELEEGLELCGVVESVESQGPDLDGIARYTMAVRYEFGSDEERQRIETAMEKLLHTLPEDRRREYPRMPVAYHVAEVDDPLAGTWTIRNLSQGGMLLEADAPDLGGETVLVGARALFEIMANGRTFAIHGTVVWSLGMRARSGPAAQLGIQFDPGRRKILDDLMLVRVKPDALRVRFGVPKESGPR